MDEMEEYFENNQGIKEKIRADGRAFANKRIKKSTDANSEKQSSEYLKNQEDKPTKTYRRPVINWRNNKEESE